MLRLTEYFGRSRSFGSVRFGFGSVRFGELCDSAEASAEASAEYSVLFGVGNISFVFTLFMSYNS